MDLSRRSAGVLWPVPGLPTPTRAADSVRPHGTGSRSAHGAGVAIWQLLPLGPTRARDGHSPYSAACAFRSPPICSPRRISTTGSRGCWRSRRRGVDPAPPPFACADRADRDAAGAASDAALQARPRPRLNVAPTASATRGLSGVRGELAPRRRPLRGRVRPRAGSTLVAMAPIPCAPGRRRRSRNLTAAARPTSSDTPSASCSRTRQRTSTRAHAGAWGSGSSATSPSTSTPTAPTCGRIETSSASIPPVGPPISVACRPTLLGGEAALAQPHLRLGASASEGHAWWSRRVTRQLELFDDLRLDHFRGFCAFWEVPADARDARGGR